MLPRVNSWELKGISNTAVLEKADNKYEAPTSGLIGSGGKEVSLLGACPIFFLSSLLASSNLAISVFRQNHGAEI
jgi:hypothetical protein